VGFAGLEDVGIAGHGEAVDVAAFAEGREHARGEEGPGGSGSSADDVEGQVEGVDEVGKREAKGVANFVEDAKGALVAGGGELRDSGGGERGCSVAGG
jgi:hypothetical protein